MDVAIIGSGPSAWSAAIYLSRANIDTTVISGTNLGGQLMMTTVIENFPGFPNGINGPELMGNMQTQAEKFGTKVIYDTVTQLDPITKLITTSDSHTYQPKSIIIATGAETIWLDVPGEKEFIGKGVSCCAVCDAAFFRGKITFVVGGGDAAMEDALALAKFTDHVTIIHRRDTFKASPIMRDRVLSNSKINIIYDSTISQISGSAKVEQITIKNLKNNSPQTLAADGVFVAIGHQPSTKFLENNIALDDHRYIKTHLPNSIYPSLTSVSGIFAAGDCVDHRYQQAIVASGEGVKAALDCQWWLESQDSN